MTKPCLAAIVGAGNIAREHLRAFGAIPGVQVEGIYSRTLSRAEQLATEFSIPHVCESVDELYNRSQAQLVVVTVSIPDIANVTRNCFRYPWTVLVEKPPGQDLAEAEDLLRMSEGCGCNVLVALNRRFLSSTSMVLADVAQANGARFIHVQDQEDLVAAAAVGHPQAVLDNWMFANSIHLIDYFSVFGRGKIQSVTRFPTPQPRFMTAAMISFESGDIGLYQCLWNRPGPWAVSVSLPAKRWELRPLEAASFQTSENLRLQASDLGESDKQCKPGFVAQAESAILAARGEPHRSPTLADALETMRLINAIYPSPPVM